MHSPTARALINLDILVRTLKHLIPRRCVITITNNSNNNNNNNNNSNNNNNNNRTININNNIQYNDTKHAAGE